MQFPEKFQVMRRLNPGDGSGRLLILEKTGLLLTVFGGEIYRLGP
jgi:hypothetical protein